MSGGSSLSSPSPLRRSSLLLLTLAVSALLLLAAVASVAEASKSEPAQRRLTTVNVQDVAGIPYDYLRVGIYQGFFRRRGLDVKVQAAAGGAVIVPAVLNGSIQFGGSNIVSTLLAASRGLPLKMIAPGTFGGPKTPDWAAIVVKRDSPIRSAKDLEGRTIAINTLRNIADVTAKASLEKRGVDSDKLRFTEVDFPQMHDALAAGRVDAAFIIEPFLYEARKAGDRVIVYPYHGTNPGMQIGSYIAHEDLIRERPNVVTAFQRGLADTSRWIAKHRKATRRFLVVAAGLRRQTAERMVLPTWKTDVSMRSLQTASALMQKYGLLRSPVDLAKLIHRRR
jgi:NitT/TauT family transport system substrate-binding protein